MASASRRDSTTLREELFEQPAAFQFFQAVRLLHKLRSDRAGVGRHAEPDDEAVRFRSDTSFVFPEGDIREIQAGEAGAPDEMTVKFLGIASPGSFGSLPTPYVEEIRRQERELRNPAMREFLDLFNHRLVSLFYRAWERSSLPVLHDLGADNPFEKVLRSVFGTLGPSFDERMPLSREHLLSRAGLLSMSPAPASAVAATVKSIFGLPTRIAQFRPGWYPIDASDQNRLGRANVRLGEDLNLGEEVLLVQSRFRLSLGPMDWERFQELLPGSEGYNALCNLVRLAAGAALDFEVQLILQATEVPETQLGGEAPLSQLGRTTWLRTDPFDEDADGAIFEPAFDDRLASRAEAA